MTSYMSLPLEDLGQQAKRALEEGRVEEGQAWATLANAKAVEKNTEAIKQLTSKLDWLSGK